MASVAPLICHSREEWLHHRGPRIGATDAAALLGLSKYKNAFELWHQKKGLMEQVEGERFARNLGLLLEDPIAELYRQETHRLAFRPRPGTASPRTATPTSPTSWRHSTARRRAPSIAPPPGRQFVFDDEQRPARRARNQDRRLHQARTMASGAPARIRHSGPAPDDGDGREVGQHRRARRRDVLRLCRHPARRTPSSRNSARLNSTSCEACERTSARPSTAPRSPKTRSSGCCPRKRWRRRR